MKQVLVTTSWDDGHKLDERLAKLLKKYNLAGTFYVSPKDREFKRSDLLKSDEIKSLGQAFEIGAHTMTHPRLSKVSSNVASQEILDSKQYLEKITGQKIVSFCYPGGNYRRRHVAMVKKAGFKYARTVRRHSFDLKGSRLEASTSVNTYNHYQDLWKIFRFAKFNPFKTIHYFQWDNLAKAMFDKVLETGGVYHLWGHSWEVEGHGDWQKLEAVFAYISNREGVNYVTNGQLVTERPKNLLIVTHYFPPHTGGIEYYALNIAQQLQKNHGWRVVVATSGQRGWRLQKTTYKGLEVYRLPYLFKVSNTPLHPLWPRWLRQIIKEEDIYIINAHGPAVGLADITVRAAKDLPVVVTYHMQSMKKGQLPADWLIGLYERYVLPRTLRAADSLICASNVVREGFLKQFLDKSQTITPGVDAEFYTPAAKPTQNTILFVGSLNKSDAHKGLRFLLKAMVDVARQQPNVKLQIAGSGTGQTDFEEQVKSLGLTGRVKFLGGLDPAALKKVYQQASVLVLPSTNDNFPLVILEAMSAGLPVIGSSVGSITELIEDGQTGYVITPADPPALVEKLNYLLARPQLAQEFGSRGRQKVKKTLSWQNQASKTARVLEEL